MYTFDHAAGNSGGTNTVSLSPTAGSVVAVLSSTSAGGGTPTVVFSDNAGSSWLNASNNVVVGSHHYSVGYTLNALSGVNTITGTFNGGTPGTCDMVAASYTGLTSPTFVAVSTPNEQASPGTGANAITANALNCGATNALMIVFNIEYANHANMSAGTGFTLRLNVAVSDGQSVEDPNAEVTGSNTGTYTSPNGGTDTFGTVSIAFADNSGAGGAALAWTV